MFPPPSFITNEFLLPPIPFSSLVLLHRVLLASSLPGPFSSYALSSGHTPPLVLLQWYVKRFSENPSTCKHQFTKTHTIVTFGSEGASFVQWDD